MNKKGFVDQLMVVIIMGIVLAGIIVLIWLGGLILPIFAGSFDDVTVIMKDTAQQTQEEGIINATQYSIVPINESIQQFEWISFAVIIILLFGFILCCFYVRTYPFLAFVWILVIFILVLVSLFLTSAYQDIIAQGDSISQQYQAWESNNFIFANLPYIITAIGIIGGIVMFALASRDKEAEATTI